MGPHDDQVGFPAPSFVCDRLAEVFPDFLKHLGVGIDACLTR
jgi:hypothetical protein